MLHNRREYLVVINTLSLSIDLGYQSSLVTYSTTWRSILLRKNSFASNGLLPFGQLSKFPSVVHMKRLNLLHYSIPLQLRLKAQLFFSKWRWNTIFHDLHWKCIGHYHIKKLCQLSYILFGFACRNRILNLALWLWSSITSFVSSSFVLDAHTMSQQTAP